MARTNVPLTLAVRDGDSGAVTATAFDQANGHVIAIDQSEKILIRVVNTFAGLKTVTINAGGFENAGLGAYVTAVGLAQNEFRYFGPFTSRRFEQTAVSGTKETITVDGQSGFTGTIEVIKLPQGSG